MTNFTEDIYLDIENYINFAYNHLNTRNLSIPSYEEIFINEEIDNIDCIDYKNYIEEAFGANWNKKFDNISINEYDKLYSIVNNE